MCDVAVSVLQQALDYLQVGLCIHCTAASSGAASAAKCMREMDPSGCKRCDSAISFLSPQRGEVSAEQPCCGLAFSNGAKAYVDCLPGWMHKKGIKETEA